MFRKVRKNSIFKLLSKKKSNCYNFYFLKISMKMGDRGNKYKKISKEERLRVINLVMNEKMTIRGAADALGIGASTARMIVKRF